MAGEDAGGAAVELIAMTIRAVEHRRAPALGQAGDIGQLVDDAGGNDQPPTLLRGAALDLDGKPAAVVACVDRRAVDPGDIG
jgi:hypothetical protein